MTTLITAPTGSISHGTMRPEDLIPCFTDELKHLYSIQPKGFYDEYIIQLVGEAEEISDYDSNEALYILDRLFASLNEFAPDECYFGSHEGDGSDYGFWSIDSDEEEE